VITSTLLLASTNGAIAPDTKGRRQNSALPQRTGMPHRLGLVGNAAVIQTIRQQKRNIEISADRRTTGTTHQPWSMLRP
jgi:hypothetical protein